MIRFSPDGSSLGVLIPRERGVRIWNLDLLRRELGKLELDWTGPPCSIGR